MEAQQCVKLSLTNRSIGLIPSIAQANRKKTNTIASREKSVLRFAKSKAFGMALTADFPTGKTAKRASLN